MLPRIKKVELGKIHINDDIMSSDFFLHPKGVEQLDKTNKINKRDFEKMLLHEPEIAIFGTGFRGRFIITEEVLDTAKKSSVDIHVLKTPEALKKFQEYARKGKKVVAHIHVGE